MYPGQKKSVSWNKESVSYVSWTKETCILEKGIIIFCIMD